jgi:hypothetical protein
MIDERNRKLQRLAKRERIHAAYQRSTVRLGRHKPLTKQAVKRLNYGGPVYFEGDYGFYWPTNILDWAPHIEYSGGRINKDLPKSVGAGWMPGHDTALNKCKYYYQRRSWEITW